MSPVLDKEMKFSLLGTFAVDMFGAYYKSDGVNKQVGKFFPLDPSVAPVVTTFDPVVVNAFVNDTWVSPDQTKIAYVKTDPANSFRQDLYVYDIGTATISRLTTAVSTATQILHPWWHPDSTKIIFSTANEGSIDRINVDGTGRINLISGLDTIVVKGPKYNFDGSLIAFFTRNTGTGGRDLHVMNADGTGDTIIKLDAAQTDSRVNFAWANLSNKISYVSLGNTLGNVKHLRRINSDGTGDIPLTVGDNRWLSYHASKAWTLDDAYVMFERTGFPSSLGDQIYYVSSDGSLTATAASPAVYGITTIGSGLPQVLADGRVYFSKYVQATSRFTMISMLPDGSDQQEIEAFVSTDRYGIEDSSS